MVFCAAIAELRIQCEWSGAFPACGTGAVYGCVAFPVVVSALLQRVFMRLCPEDEIWELYAGSLQPGCLQGAIEQMVVRQACGPLFLFTNVEDTARPVLCTSHTLHRHLLITAPPGGSSCVSAISALISRTGVPLHSPSCTQDSHRRVWRESCTCAATLWDGNTPADGSNSVPSCRDRRWQ